MGLLDPGPDPLVRGTDLAPAPDPSIRSKNSKKAFDLYRYCFVTIISILKDADENISIRIRTR
jgi:hypothetical protein